MGKRVLIVDDAAFMRMMIKDILTKNGYDVVGEAENGQVAVEKYRDLKPEDVYKRQDQFHHWPGWHYSRGL